MTSIGCPKTRMHRGDEVFFVGKEDGAVYLHETRTGSQIVKLFDHGASIPIVGLYFDEASKMLASIDSSSRVLIRELGNGWKAHEPIFDHRAGVSVDQILFSPKGSRVLICSAVCSMFQN